MRFDVKRDVRFDVRGNVMFDVRGDVRFNVRGDVRFEVRENVRFDVSGDVRFEVRGDVRFNVTGGTVGTTNTTVFENGPTPPPSMPRLPILINPIIPPIVGRGPAPVPPAPAPVPDDRHWTTGGRRDHVIYVTDRRVEHPTLGKDIGVGFDRGYTRDGRDTRCNCQGEVVWVDHKDNTVYVPIGIPSRVFPGMTGMERRKAVGAASRNGNRPRPEPSQKLTPR